ncbi:hypothetical protein SAMN04489712_10474 [Thermomonospora echinospora]|uniref:Uncharacterized protein n=1 Tax=Thermomonospora echinospora TaxID=1992 RepID=A0A1H5YL19_9ACTN|nr:hypothetical protein [Thermomonospora echinospora]SEG24831.1 hypothetical protein SAMN04489712_10474 [Thermomonospora echinospora]
MEAVPTTPDRTCTPARSGLRTGRWRMPRGQTAAAYTRRLIPGVLRGWGLGPVAGQVVPLIEELVARAAARGHGPIDVRLEFRKSIHLLLGEIRDVLPAPSEPGNLTPSREDGHSAHATAVAITYGRRPGPGGIAAWYAHCFTW